MDRLPESATYERNLISAVLERAEVPEGKPDRKRPTTTTGGSGGKRTSCAGVEPSIND
jgi:hypothetical protein